MGLFFCYRLALIFADTYGFKKLFLGDIDYSGDGLRQLMP